MENQLFWERTTDTNLVPECFNPDNLMPNDVSRRGLCLVKKRTLGPRQIRWNVQNTVIVVGVLTLIFDDF